MRRIQQKCLTDLGIIISQTTVENVSDNNILMHIIQSKC